MVKLLMLVLGVVYFIYSVITYKKDKKHDRQARYFWDGFMIGIWSEFILVAILTLIFNIGL